MASIISAGTTSGTALNMAGDTSGQLQLATNGSTTALTIDTSQNVGIGTASPTATAGFGGLTLNGTSGSLFDLRVNNTNTFRVAAIATENLFQGLNNVPMTFYTNNTERMRINGSGNVGIGTASPAYKLDVSTDIRAGGSVLIGSNGAYIAGSLYSDTNWGMIFRAKQASPGVADFLWVNSEAVELMRMTPSGELFIAGTTDRGAFNLQCNGTGVWGAGAYTNGSDERIKDNITPLDTGLDVVAKLNPVTYTYKEDWSRDQSIQTGFIAQDLLVALEGKNYVDGIVNQSSEYMSVAYQNIIPILTKAIQEQQTIINDLKARITALEGAA